MTCSAENPSSSHHWKKQRPAQLPRTLCRFYQFSPFRFSHSQMPVTWVPPSSLLRPSCPCPTGAQDPHGTASPNLCSCLSARSQPRPPQWPLLPFVCSGLAPPAVHLHPAGLTPITGFHVMPTPVARLCSHRSALWWQAPRRLLMGPDLTLSPVTAYIPGITSSLAPPAMYLQ